MFKSFTIVSIMFIMATNGFLVSTNSKVGHFIAHTPILRVISDQANSMSASAEAGVDIEGFRSNYDNNSVVKPQNGLLENLFKFLLGLILPYLDSLMSVFKIFVQGWYFVEFLTTFVSD